MDAANENLIGNEQINNEPQEELGELALEEVTDNAGRLVAEGTKEEKGESPCLFCKEYCIGSFFYIGTGAWYCCRYAVFCEGSA